MSKILAIKITHDSVFEFFNYVYDDFYTGWRTAATEIPVTEKLEEQLRNCDSCRCQSACLSVLTRPVTLVESVILHTNILQVGVDLQSARVCRNCIVYFTEVEDGDNSDSS